MTADKPTSQAAADAAQLAADAKDVSKCTIAALQNGRPVTLKAAQALGNKKYNDELKAHIRKVCELFKSSKINPTLRIFPTEQIIGINLAKLRKIMAYVKRLRKELSNPDVVTDIDPNDSDFKKLSPQEKYIMGFVVLGFSIPEVAAIKDARRWPIVGIQGYLKNVKKSEYVKSIETVLKSMKATTKWLDGLPGQFTMAVADVEMGGLPLEPNALKKALVESYAMYGNGLNTNMKKVFLFAFARCLQ